LGKFLGGQGGVGGGEGWVGGFGWDQMALGGMPTAVGLSCDTGVWWGMKAN